MSIKTTRQKRPDRVILKGFQLIEFDKKNIILFSKFNEYSVLIPKSEIPNLIKALTEVSKEVK